MPVECAQGDQPVRCPNRVFCVHQPSAVPSGGSVLVVAGCVSVVCRWWWCNVRWCGTWCQVVGCMVRWSNVVSSWLVVRSRELRWSCDVMWCHVTSFDVMWLFVWCHAMSCDVLSCDKVPSAVKWCYARGWDVMSLWCDVVGCEVILHHIVWFEAVVCCGGWKLICCKLRRANVIVLRPRTSKYYSVLQSITNYYNFVLRTTKSLLIRTTKYYNVPICLMVATHETSGTLRGATYRMQKTMELRHSW